MENEQYKQLLIDGVKLSIIDAFHQHIQNVNDMETLKKIRKELRLGENK